MFRIRAVLPMLVLPLLQAAASAQAPEPASIQPPILKISKAEYRLDQNVLEFSFTVNNHGDSVIYLDCQGQPAAARKGKTLLLSFAAADEAAADSARPQRIGARQGYQGHRRIYGLGPDALGSALSKTGGEADPAGATLLKAEMAAYPERSEGEGLPWVRERAVMVSAKPVPLAKRGKRPPPQKPVKIIKPTE